MPRVIVEKMTEAIIPGSDKPHYIRMPQIVHSPTEAKSMEIRKGATIIIDQGDGTCIYGQAATITLNHLPQVSTISKAVFPQPNDGWEIEIVGIGQLTQTTIEQDALKELLGQKTVKPTQPSKPTEITEETVPELDLVQRLKKRT